MRLAGEMNGVVPAVEYFPIEQAPFPWTHPGLALVGPVLSGSAKTVVQVVLLKTLSSTTR